MILYLNFSRKCLHHDNDDNDDDNDRLPSATLFLFHLLFFKMCDDKLEGIKRYKKKMESLSFRWK